MLKLPPKCHQHFSDKPEHACVLWSSRGAGYKPLAAAALGRPRLTSSLKTDACSLQPGNRWMKLTTCSDVWDKRNTHS